MSNLNNYIRQHLNNKWTHLVKKNACEKCSKTENLEVHHRDRFIELLDETLVLLNLSCKNDTNNYTKTELEMIRFIMQGKHLEVKTQTLCLNCHNKLHAKEDKNKIRKRLEKVSFANPYSQQKLMSVLEKIQNDSNYKEKLLEDGIMNERGIPKKYLRELSGFTSRTTFSQALENKDFQKFLQDKNITIPDKGHYVQV